MSGRRGRGGRGAEGLQGANALKLLAENLRVEHTNGYDYAEARIEARAVELEQHRAVFTSTKFRTDHPVVRVHPETGERTLLLGSFVKRLVGLRGPDSRAIIGVLQSHVERPENTVRRQWRSGDVAVWDNRATQHYGVDDSGDHERTLRRVTIGGDVPVGVDGRRSTLLEPTSVPEPTYGIASGASTDGKVAEE